MKQEPVDVRKIQASWNEKIDSGYFQGQEGHGLSLPILFDRYLQCNANDTLLEWGCGRGRESVPLSRRFASVYSVDISDSLIISNQHQHKGIEGLKFLTFPQETETTTHLPDASIDIAYSHTVMQHCLDELVVLSLQCIERKLKKGGQFAIEFLHYRPAGTIISHIFPVNIQRSSEEIVHLFKGTSLLIDRFLWKGCGEQIQAWALGVKI